MHDSHLTLADGRTLAFTEVGDPRGQPVFYFHGAPTSRLHLVPWEGEIARCGVRILSPDRPGYGRSTPHPGRAMSDWPADVAALADALGIGRFVVAGHSSGGPYAVACAALLGERVSAGVVVAGVTDMGWPGAWDGYFESEAEMMRLSTESSVVARCEELFGADGSRFLESSGLELSGPDERLLADENLSGAILASFAEAFRQGVGGYAQDVFVQGRAWPFDPGQIVAPVVVAQGDLDDVLPLAHSRHTADRIPTSTLRLIPGHGHLSISSEVARLCAETIWPS